MSNSDSKIIEIVGRHTPTVEVDISDEALAPFGVKVGQRFRFSPYTGTVLGLGNWKGQPVVYYELDFEDGSFFDTLWVDAESFKTCGFKILEPAT